MSDDVAREAALGIVSRTKRLSAEKCLKEGLLKVMGPLYAILFGGLALTFLLDPFGFRSPVVHRPNPMLLFAAMTWPAWIAWLYWSTAVPKWRVWALRNVDDWKTLEARAVVALLIWPRGWIFERTEIKSREHRALEAELLKYRDERG